MAPNKGGKSKPVGQIVADNRKARFNYEILDTFEAGIQLTGSEVKALRAGRASLGEAYATVEKSGELYLVNSHIPEYFAATRENHPPRRPRKLLMHRREIDRFAGAIQKEGLTVVPLRMYFNERGIAKLEVALARGKKVHDKRRAQRDRDWERSKARLLREHG